jgi:pimeloyl-ACP methyl ester carboxylesterase
VEEMVNKETPSVTTHTVVFDDSSYREQHIDWTSCDVSMFVSEDYRNENFDQGTAKCGSFSVPASYSLDYGADLADLEIHVLKSPALVQENKIGSLFFCSGGPGESGIELVQFLEIPLDIRKRYDVVGFDPRGVGRSSPIKCADSDAIDYYFKTVSSPENYAQARSNLAWETKAVNNCAKLNPNWWVMTSLNTVRDMDIMRAVVAPNEKLNFVGFSYGTTLGVEYIREFPQHAGRMVLDSVTSNDDVDYNQQELESTYKALMALFDMCAADPQCPGKTNAEVQALIFKAQAKANAGKLTGTARMLSTLHMQGDVSTSDDELIYDGLMSLTYGATKDSYPDFRDALIELVKGSANYFENHALEQYGWVNDGKAWSRNNSSDILNIVNCMDTDSRELRSRKEIVKDGKRFAAADPFTAKFFASDSGYIHAGKRAGCQWSWLAFNDPLIPDPVTVMAPPVNNSGQKFLIIGSRLDTVTPIENAQDTAQRLKSTLLTYEGSGHAPSFGGIRCIDDAIVAYLVDGFLPEGDIVCAI